MKKSIAMNALLTCIAVAGLTACDVDVDDPGEMPKVHVEPGRNPDVDVRGPDVDVTTKEKTITVPDIDVDVPEENENEPVSPSRDDTP